MQNTPFSIILAAEGEVLMMQNNVIAGSSDRGDGGRGNLGKSRRGDNMNSGSDTAHRVAKPRRFEALTWLGEGAFDASVISFTGSDRRRRM
jgi:hypothetical protein